MHEDEFKPVVHQWFDRNGFTVTDIPRSNCKTPDFHLASDAEESLVELKIKGDDPEELASDSTVLASGEILERSLPLTPRNRLERIVRDGHEQMMRFDPEKKCFHVLWIHCVGRDAEHLEERFRMTLFGQQRLISTERENVLHALFFGNSAFWRYRDGLDGVLLSVGSELKLCVNTLSPRQEFFRTSRIFAAHQNGLCDPRALEIDPDILTVDGDLDRNDESAVLAFLRRKYGLDHLQTFQMGAHSVWMRRPESLDE